ncbi:MAG: polyprenyl synthetase family protein [Pseudomonadota bacterium]
MSPSYQQMKAEFAEGQVKTRWMNQMKGPWDIPEVRKIEEVCSVIWERKGKRLRSQWVFWFGEAMGLTTNDLNLYAWAVEAIHTATLLHDDVIDKAPLRRGGPSANALFDNSLPILSGDYLLSDAIFQLAEQGHPRLMKLMCQAVKEVTQGEVLQYEQMYQIPESPSYFEELNQLKTSALLKWAAQVGSVLISGVEDPKLSDFALRYGSLYQFTDDILDVRGTPTKESWQDLKEGKVNEATYLLLKEMPSLEKKLAGEFLQKKVSEESLKTFQKSLKELRFESVLEREITQRRNFCLKTLDYFSNVKLQKTLRSLVQFTVERLF